MRTQSQLHSYGAVPKVQSSDDIVDANAKTAGGRDGESWFKSNDDMQSMQSSQDDGPRYEDLPFAILFLVQLILMLVFGINKGSWAIQGLDDATIDDDAVVKDVQTHISRAVFGLLLPCTVLAFFLAHVGTAVVIPLFPETAVKVCLAVSLMSTGIVAIVAIIANPVWYMWVSMLLMFGLVAFYVRRVWCMAPFAAANLTMGIKSIAENWGVYIISIFMMLVSFVWFVFWFYAANGIFFQDLATDASLPQGKGHSADAHKYNYDDGSQQGMQWGLFFLLLVSLYWTSTVLLNIVRVTTAGVVGTWCFVPEEAGGCCSSAVVSSFIRSVTYSLGSICFGSLLEAVISVVRVLAENAKNQAREDDDGCASILYCILECILSMLEDIIEYFNQWAYVLIGLYGYSYLESGRKVMELFRARGWTAIITNDLVGYVLSFTAMVIGLLTGLCGLIIEVITSNSNKSDGASFFFGDTGSSAAARWLAFGIGVFVGVFIASIMMNVIKGAVNTVIVCYADSPGKLEKNHPRLTYQMAKSWVSVFPDIGVHVPPPQPEQQIPYATVDL